MLGSPSRNSTYILSLFVGTHIGLGTEGRRDDTPIRHNTQLSEGDCQGQEAPNLEISNNVVHYLVPMRIFKNGLNMVNLVVFPRDRGISVSSKLPTHPVARLSFLRYDNCCNARYVPILPIGSPFQIVMCCINIPKNWTHPPIV